MSSWRRLPLLGALALASGCSLLVSTSGLVGTEGADAGRDGPVGLTETSVVDAGEAAADAVAPPFCASQNPKPKFCADFDEGAITDFTQRSGAVSLESAVSLSPPRSLLAVVTPSPSSTGAYFNFAFPQAPAAYETSFDIYVEEYDPSFDVELMNLHMTGPNDVNCGPDIAIRHGEWAFDEYCTKNGPAILSVSHYSKVVVPSKRWVHVSLLVTFGTTRTFSLTVDNAKPFVSVPLQATFVPGPGTVAVGLGYRNSDPTTTKLYFDNVRFDYP